MKEQLQGLSRLTIVGVVVAASTWNTPQVLAQVSQEIRPEAEAEIAQAIENLASNRFLVRQSAFESLVASAQEAIDALERGAACEDLESSTRCVEALTEIARGKKAPEDALAALKRLSTHPSRRIADLASKKVKRLTMTDEERAIAALSRAGARIHRGTNGDIFSVMVARDREVALLKHLPTLKSATLIGPDITDAGLKALANTKQISHLNLLRTAVTDSGFQHLVELNSLTNLGLSETPITSRGVRRLANIASLNSLMLHTLIDDAALEMLPELKQIDRLYLSDLHLTDDSASLINRSAHLKELNLRLRGIQDRDCRRIAEIQLPLDLSVSSSLGISTEGWASLGRARLVDLSLYDTSIDDKGLACIAAATTLTKLSIRNGRITDEGLKSLEALKDLRFVSLRETDVTQEGADQLQLALPRVLRVHVENGVGNLPRRIARPASE